MDSNDCRGCERKELEIVRLETELAELHRAKSAFRRRAEENSQYTDVEVVELGRRAYQAEARLEEVSRGLAEAVATAARYEAAEERQIEGEKERKRIVTEIRDKSVQRDVDFDQAQSHLKAALSDLSDWYALGNKVSFLLKRWTSVKGKEERAVMVRRTADLLDELETRESKL